MTLPQSVIAEDRRLLNQVESASEELARLRWHWTLDEANLDRVSMTDYARQVGVDRTQIGRYARAYQYRLSRDPRVTTFTDALELGRMGDETYAATEAIAQSRGRSIRTVRNSYSKEVRQVREVARERAERYGTTVEEEAPVVAERIVQAEQTRRDLAEERKKRLGMRFFEAEGHIDTAQRRIMQLLDLLRDVEFTDEHRELLTHSLAKHKAAVGFAEVALSGATEVDWDAELAKLAKE